MDFCPICKLQRSKYVTRGQLVNDVALIDCHRCGRFTIGGTAEAIAQGKGPLPKLSAWIRNLNETGIKVPEINSKSLEEIQVGLPDYSPREKQIILLQNIERKTEYPGKPIILNSIYDFPLSWASNQE
jgi:hypothetical protein